MFAQCLHSVCTVFAQNLRKYMHLYREFAQILYLRMFAQCLRNVCAMFAHYLRSVCACLRKVLYVCAGLRRACSSFGNWIICANIGICLCMFAQVCACLCRFAHIVRKHKSVCAVFAHVCAVCACLRRGQFADVRRTLWMTPLRTPLIWRTLWDVSDDPC